MKVLERSSYDIANPSLHGDLTALASIRMWAAAHYQLKYLPKTYPNSLTCPNSLRVYGKEATSNEDLSSDGLGSEDQRMRYTLQHFPERRLPAANTKVIASLLRQSSVLKQWSLVVPDLKDQAEYERWKVVHAMKRTCPDMKHSKDDFMTMPIDARTEHKYPGLALELWQRALHEFSLEFQDGKYGNALAFLGIYAHLRDPIGGVFRALKKQTRIFRKILRSVHDLETSHPLSSDQLQQAIAQAAQESSFLATSYVEKVTHIHFRGDQQMTYAYVPLDHLSRSEFSKPRHVLDIVREIVLSSQNEPRCPIAPVMVATYPKIRNQSEDEEFTIIIDGNHRVTAVTLLRLLSCDRTAIYSASNAKAALHSFCQEHRLGQKWHADLADVIETLFSPAARSTLELIQRQRSLVQEFSRVTEIPALIVQEESFHTVSTQRTSPGIERPKLLQPVHQAIFNDEEFGFALPNAGQIHGRTAGFKALPLLR